MRFDNFEIDAKMIQQSNVSLDQFNETLRRLRQGIAVKFDIAPFHYRTPLPEGFGTTNTQPQEPLTFDSMMEAIQSLPPAPDTTPLRANQWTLGRIRLAIPDAKWHDGRALYYPGTLFGVVVVEVDEELPDGIIKQGDTVICNIGKEQEK